MYPVGITIIALAEGRSFIQQNGKGGEKKGEQERIVIHVFMTAQFTLDI
jgi:hypothetical protein